MSAERQRDAIAQWRENGRLPRRDSAEYKRFSVPADPRSFAAQLLRKLGAVRGREYVAVVSRVLGKEKP